MSENTISHGGPDDRSAEPQANRWHSKHFRIDRGGERPGAGSLLRTFQAWNPSGAEARTVETRPARGPVRPSPVTERRAEARHARPECLAWISWRTLWRLKTRNALVIDLSRGGARVFLDEPPARNKPFWIFLEANGEKVVIRAEIREQERLANGQCAVRLRFRDPCPYSLFEAAVCGQAAADPRARMARRDNPPPPRQVVEQAG